MKSLGQGHQMLGRSKYCSILESSLWQGHPVPDSKSPASKPTLHAQLPQRSATRDWKLLLYCLWLCVHNNDPDPAEDSQNRKKVGQRIRHILKMSDEDIKKKQIWKYSIVCGNRNDRERRTGFPLHRDVSVCVLMWGCASPGVWGQR